MAKNIGRPTRQKKADRLLHSGQTQRQVMCDFAVAGLDRLAMQMDRKWGVDRLVELVQPEMAVKYGSAMAKLNDALDVNDPAVVQARAEVCMRGLMAMDAQAEAAGAERASEDVWEVEVEDTVYGIMRDGRSWPTLQEKRPELKLVTLREAAIAIEFYHKHRVGVMTDEVRKHFPKAEVVKMTEKRSLDEEIPF